MHLKLFVLQTPRQNPATAKCCARALTRFSKMATITAQVLSIASLEIVSVSTA
jgi:hypothetical protein